jgi:hypothetical protein
MKRMYEYVPTSCIHGHHHTGRQDRSENGVLPPGFLSMVSSLAKRESSERVWCMDRSSCCLLRKIKQRPDGGREGTREGERRQEGEGGRDGRGNMWVRRRDEKGKKKERTHTHLYTHIYTLKRTHSTHLKHYQSGRTLTPACHMVIPRLLQRARNNSLVHVREH